MEKFKNNHINSKRMKYTGLTLILVALAFFAGCNQDNQSDSTDIQSSGIVEGTGKILLFDARAGNRFLMEPSTSYAQVG